MSRNFHAGALNFALQRSYPFEQIRHYVSVTSRRVTEYEDEEIPDEDITATASDEKLETVHWNQPTSSAVLAAGYSLARHQIDLSSLPWDLLGVGPPPSPLDPGNTSVGLANGSASSMGATATTGSPEANYTVAVARNDVGLDSQANPLEWFGYAKFPASGLYAAACALVRDTTSRRGPSYSWCTIETTGGGSGESAIAWDTWTITSIPILKAGETCSFIGNRSLAREGTFPGDYTGYVRIAWEITIEFT